MKPPYFNIHRTDGLPMALARLWGTWKPKDREELAITNCTIITIAANEQIAPLNDRIPEVLEPEDWKKWQEADP